MVLIQTLVNGVLTGFTYSMVALGLALVFGVMDIVNFAQGEFLMIGMYISVITSTFLKVEPLLTVPLSMLGGFLLGIVVYYLFIKQLLRGPMIAQLFGTFGLMLTLRYGAQAIWGPNYRMLQKGMLIGKSLKCGSIYVNLALLVNAAIAVVCFALLLWVLNYTKTGRAIKATSLDAEAARYVGVYTDKIYALAWGVSGALAGVAGALLTNMYYVFPTVGSLFSMIAFAAVALGGFGNVRGAFLAGLILGVIELLVGQYISPAYKLAFIYLTYFAVVSIRPQGLFGW